ncbi:cytidine deaminase [Alloscardovia macacae]|uniref:tRNA-specific adenosine deaminase n=1 Tax=Alloscardovia macacae TaxID=1160091 RepID=A0A261F6W5_9BIFI|nr:cytidine deaminase [Alloscardovia macacae]
MPSGTPSEAPKNVSAHTAPHAHTTLRERHRAAMGQALDAAREAASAGEVPVGAVVLDARGQVLAIARNRREELTDPLSHAEVEAMRAAARVRGDWKLEDCTLVVTLEPCPMCAGAAVSAHMGRVVFGAWDEKMGALGSVWDIARDPHDGFSPEVYGGVRAEECAQLLREFFAPRRGQSSL